MIYNLMAYKNEIDDGDRTVFKPMQRADVKVQVGEG